MQPIQNLHTWDLTPSQARDLQQALVGQVRLTRLRKKPRFVAGLDCAFNQSKTTISAAAVVLTFPQPEFFETASAKRKVANPVLYGALFPHLKPYANYPIAQV
jgi:deoxyinosine 3'endonuclease (endonuclease V)